MSNLAMRNSAMDRIKKYSRIILLFINFLIVALPILHIFVWVFMDTPFMQNRISEGLFFNPVNTPEGFVLLSDVNWTLPGKLMGLGSSLMELLPLFIGLFSLRAIFQNYMRESIFTPLNARHYRRLGFLFFLYALIAEPLSRTLMVLGVTLSNPPGHHYLTFGFGTPNMQNVFCGFLIMVISWVMLEGSKINEEQRMTV